jgi:DNA-3-methyladenine glycosylase II
LKWGEGLLLGSPEPRRLALLAPRDLHRLGFSRQKSRVLIESARIFATQSERFEALADCDDESAMKSLTQLKGIGRWSAAYIMLRGLGKLNVFPADDVGGANNLRRWLKIGGRSKPGYDEIRAKLQKWHPFEGMVYFYLLLASLASRGCIDAAAPQTLNPDQIGRAARHD